MPTQINSPKRQLIADRLDIDPAEFARKWIADGGSVRGAAKRISTRTQVQLPVQTLHYWIRVDAEAGESDQSDAGATA